MLSTRFKNKQIPLSQGPTCHSNLTTLTCESLVSGYIRRCNTVFIPAVLINLCLSYYKKIFRWTLNAQSLIKYNEDIHSKLFNVNGIIFQCVLRRLTNGFMEINFVVNSPTIYGHSFFFISYISSQYEILCQNTNMKLLYSGTLQFIPLRHRYPKPSEMKSDKNLNLLDINKPRLTLTILCCLDILQIKYDPRSTNYILQPPHPTSNVIMYDKVKADWNVHKTLLMQLKSIDNRGNTFIGPIIDDDKFDKIWRLAFIPHIKEKTYVTQDYLNHVSYFGNGPIFVVKLRRRSSTLVCERRSCCCYIKAKIEVNIFYDGYYLNITSNTKFRNVYVCCKLQCKFEKSINQINSLLFKVKIEISQLMNCNGHIIPKNYWNGYGVLHNEI